MTTHWPAEWESHEATLIAWPWDRRIWGEAFGGARHAIAIAAAMIARSETVFLLVDEAGRQAALAQIAEHGPTERVVPLDIPTDDIWLRDSGPTFVWRGAELIGVDWNFCGWGRKFAHENDRRVAERITSQRGTVRRLASICLEGGGLETNGQGVVLSTKSVALNANRNPRLTLDGAGDEISRMTGATAVVWLAGGMANDDTDGHVDTLARFVGSDTVLLQRLPQRDRENERANRVALDNAGLTVVELPRPSLPGVPASYANFYWCNSAVLMPVYGVPEDDEACAIVRAQVDRDLIRIDSRALISQGGAIHCATQQVPARQFEAE